MKILLAIFMLAVCLQCTAQAFDSTRFRIEVDTATGFNSFFQQDQLWRGGDGASSIDLGNGKILWLFGDSFISDSVGSRKKAEIVRNSIAIQNGYDLKTATISFYWEKQKEKPYSFFPEKDSVWYWPGHGTMINDRLLIFCMRIKKIPDGFGFETTGWDAVLISNPTEDPVNWKMKFIEGADCFGTVAGSAAVLKDKSYLYAYGAVEPGSHDVYLLRWNLKDAYNGKLQKPQWWLAGKWGTVKSKDELPKPLFNGATEYSVHFDSSLRKYIQVQSFGFGEASIGLRMANKPEGPWTETRMIYTPGYQNIFRPFMYSAKAHPEFSGNGFLVTYNINSFDFDELLKNQAIYFPRLIRVHIGRN